MTADPPTRPAPGTLVRRHTRAVRLMHWINVLAFFLLLMSGLRIFNAYPVLAWGKSSYTGEPPWVQITAHRTPAGELIGMTRVFDWRFKTTGVLGASRDPQGTMTAQAFPSWATLPGTRWLAMARNWHFFFAWVLVINGLLYLIHAVRSRHLARDLLPTRRDWTTIGTSIRDHLRLRHPRGEAARHYNVLQKLAYLAVIFGLVPLVIVTGMAMSPMLDAVLPGWVDLLGGRQSARTLHFLAAFGLVVFVLVHVFQVIVTGLWNNLRSMLTGRYRLPPEEPRRAQT